MKTTPYLLEKVRRERGQSPLESQVSGECDRERAVRFGLRTLFRIGIQDGSGRQEYTDPFAFYETGRAEPEI